MQNAQGRRGMRGYVLNYTEPGAKRNMSRKKDLIWGKARWMTRINEEEK